MMKRQEPLTDYQAKCLAIATDKLLSPRQKANFLAIEAESNIPYLSMSKPLTEALNERVICDMYEGNAPYKPRYVLPDYVKFLKQGSSYLELAPAEDFDDALNHLMIIYNHVPSVTGFPVFLGYLDKILMPYVGELTEEQLYPKLKRFWVMLDRTLPDAFMHANIGPDDNIICRLILRIDAELKQVAPNLTFVYHPQRTPESLFLQAIENICECSKPHIANDLVHSAAFDEQGYGIVSCYNSLPVAGGGSTLVRINLREVALRSQNSDDFLQNQLKKYCDLQMELIETRSAFLFEESNFFQTSFLVHEGLIEPRRFAPMFGIFGLAEAVNLLMEKDGRKGQYEPNSPALPLSYQISEQLADYVESTPVKYGYKQRAMLHAQSGISSDIGTTPGARLPYGEEPDPVSHIQAVAPHHKHYLSGISDILTIDETIKQNPQALLQLCKGAFSCGMREFTANVASNDLVRVTGYMVRLSDIEKFKTEGSRSNTTWLGEEATKNCKITARQQRVISHEQSMRYTE
ncbi:MULTISPECIES: YjjI family glycine radical enzyme [Providencia]|uniref:YjjI family glycine radical enzyme n=1 Tax=Providencia TaxID=586 RepID=UPI001980425C|nr:MULTISPECIES: YjjI family glycine radical enzyme [Providencia]HEC8329386.1 YjjI family glycine radical enzyme [Providencia rettgeri]MBN4863371.1 YjjI family glycine radical enzyme [Providencia stuartii]MBN4876370.1 YjjI family glycine radical enzyme [Providencia stuartii]MBN4878186.1 YjjI family glycine radical enzyme [Providencia stuartii]MBN4881894.1 YjjI family glycine radical enzyme [Providencia stuartii]